MLQGYQNIGRGSRLATRDRSFDHGADGTFFKRMPRQVPVGGDYGTNGFDVLRHIAQVRTVSGNVFPLRIILQGCLTLVSAWLGRR